MLAITQLTTQLQLQGQLNAVVNPSWLRAGYAWHTAAMVEAVEALDHHGWKWWKAKGEPDWPQVRIELVDIWHFMLSDVLVAHGGDLHSAAAFVRFQVRECGYHYKRHDMRNLDFVGLLHAFTAEAARGEIALPILAHLVAKSEMSWDALHRMYVGKNVLNLFRQAHGYKAGTYVKTWHGREDNVTLEALIANRPHDTPTQLLHHLEAIYETVITATTTKEPA